MKIFLGVILVLLSWRNANAESAIVYGDGFGFSFNIPAGWDCICDGKDASEIGANALLFKKGTMWRNAESIIFFRVNSAIDDKVDQNIKADMENYKKSNPDTVFKDIRVNHPSYKTASKLFIKPKLSAEYVTYVAPKPFPKMNISCAMNVQKREAKLEEINAYQKVIASIVWLGKMKGK